MNNIASLPFPLPPQAAPLNETALCRWIGAATPGDAITYFRGTLARSLCPQLGLLDDSQRASLGKLAQRAWKLADDGLAFLVQRRHGYEDYEYVLVARRRPRCIQPSLLPRILAEAA